MRESFEVDTTDRDPGKNESARFDILTEGPVAEEALLLQPTGPSSPKGASSSALEPPPPGPARTAHACEAALKHAPANAQVGLQLLTGTIHRWRNTWQLRYAGYDVADPLGGSVTLEGGPLGRARDGCEARVQGRLVPAEDSCSTPIFQVQTLEVLNK